ncbi:YcnI family protein [Spirillospora sp. NPDC049652]
MSSKVRARRVAAVAALAGVSLVGFATAASAHVTVNPGTAEKGGFAKVSFRVPNEKPNAGTTQIKVDLPADHPLAFVSARPVPGWTVKVAKTRLATPLKAEGGELTEAVSSVTWSGGRIDPGQFQEFDLSLGPLPDNADRLLFKAVQTYSDKSVVNWDQDPGDGADEPEHPAPVLKLTPKAATGTADRSEASASPKTGDGTARTLGGVGIAVGVVGVGVGAAGLVRARNARSGS